MLGKGPESKEKKELCSDETAHMLCTERLGCQGHPATCPQPPTGTTPPRVVQQAVLDDESKQWCRVRPTENKDQARRGKSSLRIAEDNLEQPLWGKQPRVNQEVSRT